MLAWMPLSAGLKHHNGRNYRGNFFEASLREAQGKKRLHHNNRATCQVHNYLGQRGYLNVSEHLFVYDRIAQNSIERFLMTFRPTWWFRNCLNTNLLPFGNGLQQYLDATFFFGRQDLEFDIFTCTYNQNALKGKTVLLWWRSALTKSHFIASFSSQSGEFLASMNNPS